MLKRLQIPPGIHKESTQYAALGQWYDGDNIRFRRGNAEVIGGWFPDPGYELQGLGRETFSSRDYSGNNYQFVGTDWKFYCIVGAAAFDITPVRESGTLPTDPFTALVDDPNLLVRDVGHGLAVNDWVVLDNVTGTTGGSFTEALLEQAAGFQVSSIESADSYKLYIVDSTTGLAVEADSGGAGGGDPTYSYKIASGLSAQTEGQAWGVGLWGGSATPTAYSLNSTDGLRITKGAAAAEAVITGETAPTSPGVIVAGDQIYIKDLDSESIKGVPTDWVNNEWWTVTAIDSTYIDFTLSTSDGAGGTIPTAVLGTLQSGESAGAASGGGGSGSYYRYDASELAVDGATRGWNDSSEESILTGSIRRVYIDNYGEDVMFANSGGPIYYWDVSANSSSGVPTGTESAVAKELNTFSGFAAPPDVVDSFLISKRDGHCVALGCNDVGKEDMNSLLVRWSDQNNPFDWVPSITNTSGGQVLRVGSRILGGISTQDEVVVFTDAAVYSMRFVGPPDVFSFNLMSQGVEIISGRTAVNVSNAVFFMGKDGFYSYTGSVAPLSSTVANYVFDDFNVNQQAKCFAAVNSAFSEIMWFYPSANSFEPDRYVMFNYQDNVWSLGSFDMNALDASQGTAAVPSYGRTAWRDAIVFGNPMASYIMNYAESTAGMTPADVMYAIPLQEQSAVMIHERGTSAQSGMLNSFIESGEVDISDGERFSFFSRLIPDLQVFNASSTDSATVTIAFEGRDFPGQSQASLSSTDVVFTVEDPTVNSTFTPIGSNTAVRGRARSVSMKVSSSASNFQWRLGDTRLDVRPDGRR